MDLIPVRQEDGSLESLVLIVHDLTERRREEAEKVRAEKLESLATLTSGVAHEIKNPLNSLKIHAQLLQRTLLRDADRADSEERSRAIKSAEVILEETERVAHIVDQFLQASRPTRPQLAMHNVNDILERLASIVRPELKEKRIELRLRLDPSVPMTLIDEHQTLQAFHNIVRNSIEAIEDTKGLITIRTSTEEQFVVVEFEDNGCGIPEERLHQIWEPYFTTKVSGTGLGLMIVYRIVREHSGFLNIDSRQGQGTTVTLGLPLAEKPHRLLTEK